MARAPRVPKAEKAPKIDKVDELVNKITAPDQIITFKCNLENARIKHIQFSAGYYNTSNPSEIAFLRAYGAQQGCIVTEVIRNQEQGE